MGKHPSITIALFTLVIVGSLIFVLRPERHKLHLSSYFQDAAGLRPGATVRVAGVDVGTVTSVRVKPELHDHPAEIRMLLQTSYPLEIPNDSVVNIKTMGLLGENYADIDIHGASGSPVQDGATLKAGMVEEPSSQQLLDCLNNIAEHKPCNPRPTNNK